MTVRDLVAQLVALPDDAQDLLVLLSVGTTVGEVAVLGPDHPSGEAVTLLHADAGILP